jgi:hypothetical protein
MNYQLETRYIIICAVALVVGWMLWSYYKKESFAPVPGWIPRQYSKYDPYYVYGMEYEEPAMLSTYNPLWSNVDSTHPAVPMATKTDPGDVQHPVKLVEPPKDIPDGKPPMEKPIMVKHEMPIYDKGKAFIEQVQDWITDLVRRQTWIIIAIVIAILVVWYLWRRNTMKKMMEPIKTMSETIKNLFKKKPKPMTSPAKTIGMKSFF